MQVRIATHLLALPHTPLASPIKTIDWNNSSDRKWLMNHLHHCMMNAKRVTLTPECETDMLYRELTESN